ncbi:MAG TPA: helix-turn-helix domain-containing protein [Saprospiraceae bacterium]|nr:helix-turn-helix domain-containing protein [Saprospiraceae bacterium]HND90127.1 helix-turn-helix domain-containing protein [Saprospiraceae bacterium]
MGRKFKMIQLPAEERAYLEQYVKQGRSRAVEQARSRILLLSDRGETARQIATLLDWHYGSVMQILRRYELGGLERALFDAPRSGAPRKLTPELEARVSALACSEAPDGHVRWTAQMLADEIVRLEAVESISASSIGTVLKKGVKT